MRILLVLFLCVITLGCAAKTPQKAIASHCHEAWVYAPAAYILDLASNSEVLLNPAVHDFPLYCSAKEAEEALSKGIASKELPDGDWALFRLAGDYSALVRFEGDKAILKEMAVLVDWEKRNAPQKK